MDKKEWGPIFWYIIHKFSENITNENINKIKRFYLILPYILPCNICSNHTVEYLKKDNPNICYTSSDLLRWTFRFHNNTNILLGKKTEYYSILQKYKKKLDHKITYKFINILNKLLKVSYNILYKKYYEEMIDLLQYILPCNVCSENINLVKNNILYKDCFYNFMYSHFPKKNSNDIYKETGIKNIGIEPQINNNIISGNIYNNFNLYKYYPVLSNQKYKLNLYIVSISKNELFIKYNNKTCNFTINKQKTNIINNKFSLIEFKTPYSISPYGLLKINIKHTFSKNGTFIIGKINIF